jgi:hypothetical protein
LSYPSLDESLEQNGLFCYMLIFDRRKDSNMGKETNSTTCKTLSVPEAGKVYFGMARGASYQAAARGEIPTIRIGRMLRVPIIQLERMLSGDGG